MKEISGSDTIGVKKFYTETKRLDARKFEDDLTLKFIEDDEVKIKNAFNHKKCPLCGSNLSNSTYQFKKNGFKHWMCDDCGGIYTNPSIDSKTIEYQVYGETLYPFLDSVNSSVQVNFDTKRFKQALDRLVSLGCETHGNVMDFGCGSGLFLNICREYGFKVLMGNDLLRRAIDLSRNVYGLDETRYINGYEDICRVDSNTKLIALWEFLDHINEPQIFLDKLIQRLEVGTFLIISVRNSKSLAARVMRDKCNMFLGHAHFNFWSIDTLNIISEKFNLQILDSYQYISEREAVKNFLNYQSIYNSVSEELSWLPSEDQIFEHNLGYKHVAILQKIEHEE